MKYTYVELSCAMHAPLDKNVKLQFNLEANAICELYNRLLPECKIKYLKKIRVDLTPDLQAHTYIAPAKPLKYSFVCTIANSFDFDVFFQKNVIERKKALLEVLQQNIRAACTQFDWDMASFEEAYQKIQEVDYVNKFIVWGNKFFPTKNKDYQAAVELKLEVASARISILFFDSTKQLIKTVEVTQVRPHSLFLSKMFGKGKWVNKEFVLSNKENEIHFIASLDSDQVKLSLTPIHQSEEQLLNELKILHPDTSQDEAIKFIEMNRTML